MKVEEVGDNIISKVADRKQLPVKLRTTAVDRRVKADSKLEKQMHNQFSGWLYMRKKLISKIHPDPSRKSTIEEGHPDYTLLRNGQCLMIEFKVPPNGLSDIQLGRFAELEQAGNVAFVCTTLADAIELTLETFGLQPGQLE
jgi:hypothetical protein